MLNIIQQGQINSFSFVCVKHTKFNISVLLLLQRIGYIYSYTIVKKSIYIKLKYNVDGTPLIKRVAFLNKKNAKNNIGYKNLNLVANHYRGSTLCILTNKGMLTHLECIKYRCGGFLTFRIN